MDRLTENDLLNIKVKAGNGDGPVTLDRRTFDALMDGYTPYRHDYQTGGLKR